MGKTSEWVLSCPSDAGGGGGAPSPDGFRALEVVCVVAIMKGRSTDARHTLLEAKGSGGIGPVLGQIDQELSEAALGSRVVSQNRRECVVAERLGEALAQCFAGPRIIAQPGLRLVCRPSAKRDKGPGHVPEKTPHHMLKETGRLLLDQLCNHVTEDSADSVEAFVGGADVVETVVV